MELTIRDWMVVIGVVLIVAVGLDAWRRVRKERYAHVKMKLAPVADESSERDEELAWLRELPNGGGRTIDRRDLVGVNATGKTMDSGIVDEAKPRRKPRAKLKKKESLNPPAGDDVELVTGISSTQEDDVPQTLDWLDNMASSDGANGETAETPGSGKLPREVDQEVFMLNVVARHPGGFRGEDILHILLACDLRFGDMNFFHRHEFEAGRGAIQFSVANMMQPGVFDIDNMSDFKTPGLVFFLTLPGPEDMMKAFDYMLETAQAVARNLGGDVLDESRSVLTKQTLDHCRQQIRDLERRLLARTT
ncbi:MAG: cell division protein ZipA [Pseudomonadota bacterium]